MLTMQEGLFYLLIYYYLVSHCRHFLTLKKIVSLWNKIVSHLKECKTYLFSEKKIKQCVNTFLLGVLALMSPLRPTFITLLSSCWCQCWVLTSSQMKTQQCVCVCKSMNEWTEWFCMSRPGMETVRGSDLTGSLCCGFSFSWDVIKFLSSAPVPP